MSQPTITQVKHEISRRAGLVPREDRAASGPAFSMSNKELQAALAAKPARTRKAKPTQAKAAKVRTPEQELRERAWTMRCEAKAAGKRLTYREACATLGVSPARG